MRIRHIGSLFGLPERSAAGLTQVGVEATWCQLSTPPEEAVADYDVVHLYYPPTSGGTSLQSIEPLCRTGRERSCRIVHHLFFGEAELFAELRERALIGERDLVLVGRADAHPGLPKPPATEWAPAPFFFGQPLPPNVDPSPRTTPNPQEVRICAFVGPTCGVDKMSLEDAFQHARAQRLKFHSECIEIGADTPPDELRAIIERCDLVIESGEGTPLGPLGIQALGFGRAVLGGCQAAAPSASAQAKLCPVLETNSGNLSRRIVSLVKEPKALRDLSVRAQRYARDFHNCDQDWERLGELSRALVSGARPRRPTARR